jgi:hypothetical protein
MQFTVIPLVATSNAVDLVKPATPCFAAQYGALKGEATLLWKDPILMMRPQPASAQQLCNVLAW